MRRVLDARMDLLRRCRAVLGGVRLVERDGRVGPAHYELRGYHLGDVAALVVAIDIEGEYADVLGEP